MGEVDQSFIQAVEHRPKLTIIEAEGIPLIDLSISDTQLLVSQIGDACENWGFFQVINHGVPALLREKLEFASKSFFALPKEEKLVVRRDESNPFGYYDTELTKNVRDWKEVFDFTVENPTILPASPEPDDKELIKLVNYWPAHPKDFRYNFIKLAMCVCLGVLDEEYVCSFVFLPLVSLKFKNIYDAEGVEQKIRVQINKYRVSTILSKSLEKLLNL